MLRHTVVGLLYTRTCPLACRHCIISSSPREREKMSPERARELIAQVPEFCDTVCFTGGEPMLYYNEIVPLIGYARSLGLQVTLVTGCGWVSASRPQIALERIAGLKRAGLDTLCVSWDSYHEEFSPREHALLVIEQARAVGLKVMVRGVVNALGAAPAIAQKLVTLEVPYEQVKVIRLGTAATLPEDHFTFSPTVPRGGCSTVLTPTVEPDGTVYACCGPSRGSRRSSPLVLGNVNEESLAAILDRGQRDPLLEAIYHVGLFGLYELLKSDPRFQAALPARRQYTGMCELCLDLCDTPAVVALLRERLSQQDAAALVAAARLLQGARRGRESQVPAGMETAAGQTPETECEVYA